LLAQIRVLVQQQLLLIDQRLQPLTKFGVEDARQLLKQGLHGGNASPRLSEGLALQLQIEVSPFHTTRPYCPIFSGSMERS